jgi:anti-sigma factor RsiW
VDHEGYTEELLGLRALGRLSEPERAVVDRHLAECERCRQKLEYVGQAADYLARFERDDVDDLLEVTESATPAEPTNVAQPDPRRPGADPP